MSERNEPGEPARIFFCIYPAGEIVATSVNAISEDQAIAETIRHFLPAHLFPNPKLGHLYHGVIHDLWPSMKEAGFKVLSIETPCKGVSY